MNDPAAKPSMGVLKWALWGAALTGVAAVLYIIAQASFKPAQSDGGVKAFARGEMSKLVLPVDAGAPPATSFQDAGGKPVRIADFRGRVAVVNLWATWCAPCVEEMPTLAKLQAVYADQPVSVVTVSVDSAKDAEKARLFIEKHAPLKFYIDPKMKLPFAFTPAAAGMPTTIIYGKDGMERARLSGGADWSGKEARALIDHLLAEG